MGKDLHQLLWGAYNYFPDYDDSRQSNNKEPFGARASFGSIGEYIEVPYRKFIEGETIILHPKDVSDHDNDAWQWQANYTVSINPE